MLTPVDIENKDFKKVMRGYDVLEVDAFLRDLVSDYEKLYRENSNMKDKIEMLSSSLANYRSMEETMQNAMIVAQSTADDIKKNAAERANNIIAEAQIKANEVARASEKEISDLNMKYQALKGEIDAFKSRVRALVLTYDKMLDDFPNTDAIKPLAEEALPEEKAKEPALEKPSEPDVTKKMDSFEEKKPQESQGNIYEKLEKVSKKETPENPRLDKQNAILEEILTQRAEKIESQSPFKSKTVDSGEVKEVIINLGADDKKSSSYYDVFSDPTI